MREQRDIGSDVTPTSGFPSPKRNLIAAIGIDHYTTWRRLTNAVSDARGAAAAFTRLGFEPITEPLLDDRATGKALHELVTDDLATIGTDDSLVLFYAGHGGTRTHRIGNQLVKTGYLIPVDASDKVATWIELDSWLRAISLLPVRHVLVILDACRSGIALGPLIKWRDAGASQESPLSMLAMRRSRRIITSALDDQVALDSGPVHGHSLFTGCLIEGLSHGIGRGEDQLTTGSELGLYLQRRVETYPNSRQTPDFGAFDFDDRGELLIPLRPREPATHEIESITPVTNGSAGLKSTSPPACLGEHGAEPSSADLVAAKFRAGLGRFRGRRRWSFVAMGALAVLAGVTVAITIALTGGHSDNNRAGGQQTPEQPGGTRQTPSEQGLEATTPAPRFVTSNPFLPADATTAAPDAAVDGPSSPPSVPKAYASSRKLDSSSANTAGAAVPGSRNGSTRPEPLSKRPSAPTDDAFLDMRH